MDIREFFMKNTIKVLVRPLVCVALAAVIGFSMTACETDTSSGTGHTPGNITWTLEQTGGILDNDKVPTSATTAIEITFSDAVSLTDTDITIGGAASRGAVALSSSGNVWIVPVTVSKSDNATVTVNKTGVAGGTKTVMVYKLGERLPIDWTAAANGTANSVTSTAITFTFTEAVTGLTENDITLTAGTGSATIGNLTGSGTSWTLAITVINQGEIKVAIAQTGISATEKTVQVHKKSENPVSGKTTYRWDDKYEFSTASGNNGTFTVYSPKKEYVEYEFDGEVEGWWDRVSDANGKYIYIPSGNGTYTWNQSAQTVTITVVQAAFTMDTDSVQLLNKTQWGNEYRSELAEGVEEMISEMMSTGMTRPQAEQAVLQYAKENLGASFTTIDQALNYAVNEATNEYFGPQPFNYSFSNDGVSFFLWEPLPAPKGTDQLAGKTYYYYEYYHDWDPETGESTGQYVKNEYRKFVFSSSGRTYTYTNENEWDWGDKHTGSYSYDSAQKRFYYRPTTVNDQTPAEYYDDVDIWENYVYPDDAAYRTVRTIERFSTENYMYDTDLLGFGWFNNDYPASATE